MYTRLNLLFVAAGTGFAPCKAMIEQALKDKFHAPIYLYWGARRREDLYWHEKLIQLAAEQQNFYYTPVLSSHQGRVYDAVLKDHQDLSGFHLYASGPLDMVLTAQKLFAQQKLNACWFYSDWLDYSQPKKL